ncbi:hypothetical protein B0T17DRAFT_593614 [Bombardia bombarda]|uniref:Nucleoporin Pom152 n=1 Tax=Bombardia bombarda TaxID=252184 RepID=A0AA39U2M1_9PEZI|nr:hypothetical protein B0T17DRAFT_593614 [Bombardia bombarda]
MSDTNPIGAFPQTPVAPRSRRSPGGMPPTTTNNGPLPIAPQQGAPTTRRAAPSPFIPLHVLDAPSQRLYALAIYIALLAWKFYDWAQVVEENTESFWLFLKWIAIDCVFLFGLPELRIPWLELSQPFVVVAFFLHAIFDWMLMFNVGLPWQSVLLGFFKVFYDRELAISEHQVKISNILHNSSLIMGRQIINILPEGSVVLNPETIPFCLGGERKIASIPIYFNATLPIEVELIRIDLESNAQEVIKLTRTQLRDIERQAKRQADGEETAVRFDFPAKKPGAYRLGKVLDEYKLEVQRRTPLTYVVPCPRATISSSSSSNRCIGESSDLSLQVEGTPPLKTVYSRSINGRDPSIHYQTLHPEGFSSPLLDHARSVTLQGPAEENIAWAQSLPVSVSLDELMHVGGQWQYSVDEVHDAFGNVVKYASPADDPEGKPKPKHLVQNLVVKERPRIRLRGCDPATPLKVPKGDSIPLPVVLNFADQVPDNTAHSLSWQFSPIDTLTESGDHGDVVSVGSYNARNSHDLPRISAPGLYSLTSVTAGSCDGEVQEPSSCLLLNPLEPKLALRAEEIPDVCAGNSIGLSVNMDLIGTPPFTVIYDVVSNGVTYRDRYVSVQDKLRYHMDLIPGTSGHHTYRFTHISDSVYKNPLKLTGPEYLLEQDVFAAANAMIQFSETNTNTCLGDEAPVEVLLTGTPPFTLEWEVVHDGKRKQYKVKDITKSTYQIKTAPLTHGGEYTIALTGVQDTRACRISLTKEEIKLSVRRQSPRVSFGQVEGKRRIRATEGSTVKLPLRLTGEGPWKVSYTNLEESDSPRIMEQTLESDNDFLRVRESGLYSITDIWDNMCHGVIDQKTSTFQVDWIPRPELSVVLSPSIQETSSHYTVDSVCESDISSFEVSLKGTPPYHVNYEVRNAPLQGSSSLSRKEFDSALGRTFIQMDTAKAGLYTYKFTSVADELYNNNQKLEPVEVKQKVNRKPTAAFTKPGQTFKYCKSEQGEDKIPITLSGVPPFSLEVEIKHQGSPIPEIFRTQAINSNSYELQIPRNHLRLGMQHIRIRDVKDASGCHSTSDLGGGSSVQVHLYEAPTIYPLETRADYCVGERISYTLSGTPPFEVRYMFDGTERKAKSDTTNFRRVAELPGEFTITTVSDKASECRAPVNIMKHIHPMPSVRISKGKSVQVDIHEGSEVEILFEFWGTPPFEFTYTRSSNAKKGQKSQVLETKHDVSHEHSKVVRANQEGTYEVVAIKDLYCSFSTQQQEAVVKGQKLLQ